jgi:hypothetical protein
MRSSRKMDKAYWTCSRPRLAPTFVASHETMEVAGGYQAGRDNLTSGDLSRARHVSSCAQDCAILVFIALRSPLGFRPIGRPAFRPPSLPALRKNIRRGRSSLHLQLKLMSPPIPNCRFSMPHLAFCRPTAPPEGPHNQ